MTDIIEPGRSPLLDAVRGAVARTGTSLAADWLADELTPVTPAEAARRLAEGARRWRRLRHKRMQREWLKRGTPAV